MQKKDELHPQDKRNLILFAVASLLVWVGFNHYVIGPRLARMRDAKEAAAQAALVHAVDQPAYAPRPRAVVLAESPRLKVDNGAVFGTVALKGGRFDDLSLQRYYTTLADTDHVTLLSPAGTDHPEYIESGWVSADDKVAVPGADTVWKASGATLGKDTPVTLSWDNGHGLRFERVLSIDENYLITTTDRVTNTGKDKVSLSPYALVSEHGRPEDASAKSGRVFEGPESFLDGSQFPSRSLFRPDGYAIMAGKPAQQLRATTGWIGISQKYWFTGLIPDQKTAQTFRLVYTPSPDPTIPANKPHRPEKYQVDVTGDPAAIGPGETKESVTRFFVGAKDLKILNAYAAALPDTRMDLVIDWGLYFFLTKPFFYILDFLGHLTGNFGIALVCLTILVRLAVFPLASTSFRSFAKMKTISPQMKELRSKYSDDREKLQAALVELYEKEKVNPMAGCFPLLLQIPIFFALYKVLSVTIEMRHAPFFGWIHDLSAQDPTSVFNLFGLIPWTPPAPLMIGGWSCLMLLAMLAQRRLSPPPQDPAQAISANYMPFFVTYIMSKFPAGLVIYWTFSNTFAVVQQYIIMRQNGAEVHLFRRSRSDKDMAKMVADGPSVHPGLATAGDEIEKAVTGEDTKLTVSSPKPKKKKKR